MGQPKHCLFKQRTKYLALTLALFLFFIESARTKVDPPNYNFSFEALEPFRPGLNLSDIQKKYGDGEIMDKNGPVEMRKFYISHIRYKFAVIVQSFESKVIDSYARLPSYFLHNVFHQTLITKLGKQKNYSNKDGTSEYEWRDSDGIVYKYQGACTITCFPIFLSMQLENFPKGAEMAKPILSKLQDSKL